MREFEFTVYSNRWGHDDTYRIKFIDTGWDIQHMAINGECKPNGERTLYMNLEQDDITYPSDFGNYLEWLWEQINDGEITDENEIQTKLSELADWVSICEKNTPKWKGWNVSK